MTQQAFSKFIVYGTLIISLYILGMLFWEFFHGGVTGHNLLKREDMPYISNWWGALLFPIATFLLLKRVENRIEFGANLTKQKLVRQHIVPFLVAVLYAILIVVFSSTGNSEISYLMFLVLFMVALFVPIYNSEYVLGFIIGLSFAFGGALPIVVAVVLSILYYSIYNYLRPLFLWVGGKIAKGVNSDRNKHDEF